MYYLTVPLPTKENFYGKQLLVSLPLFLSQYIKYYHRFLLIKQELVDHIFRKRIQQVTIFGRHANCHVPDNALASRYKVSSPK